MKKRIMNTSVRKSIFIIVIATVVFVLLSELLCLFRYGGKRKDSLITVTSDALLIGLNDYSNAQEWLKTEASGSDKDVWEHEYADKTIFGTHFYFEDGSKWKISGYKPVKNMAYRAAVYAEEPISVLYSISPFIKVYDVAIIESFEFAKESAVYYSTNKGEYIYFYDLMARDKHYLFPIEDAYKVSEFFEANVSSVHVDGGKSWPAIDEYEGVEEFEIKPLTAIYYVKIAFGFVLFSAIVFAAVFFVDKKRAKTKMKTEE